ncbi:MAG TPA: hypothetical protein VKB58_07680 [Terriglobales bacterium]|nr:hypothetical protein [Terriglobales bacterium]
MTDEEYRDYLVALAQKHLKAAWFQNRASVEGSLGPAIEQLSSTARFTKMALERRDDPAMTQTLSQELRTNAGNCKVVIQHMRDSGILDALDEAPEITFGEIRKSAIPAEDIQLLKRCGVDYPEAEIITVTELIRRRWVQFPGRPSTIAEQAPEDFMRAADLILSVGQQPGAPAVAGVATPYPAAATPGAQPAVAPIPGEVTNKKKKLLNGIGKILVGVVAGAGNVLLLTGTILAPNPATAYGAITSSAMALGTIFQGAGDLRGE